MSATISRHGNTEVIIGEITQNDRTKKDCIFIDWTDSMEECVIGDLRVVLDPQDYDADTKIYHRGELITEDIVKYGGNDNLRAFISADLKFVVV